MNNFTEPTSGDPSEAPFEAVLESGENSFPDEDSASFTPTEVREVTQELLRYGYIEEQRKPAYFRRSMVKRKEIAIALEPLDLALEVDEHRGVAFLIVGDNSRESHSDTSEWRHPLIRRQRLTLEQSLLIAILRQAFVLHEQETGIGISPAKLAIEDLLPQFLTYFQDSGSDAKNESRISILLDQLKIHGIVSEVDKNGEFTIRPLIAHLANPDSLAALLHSFQEKAEKGQQESRNLDS